MTDFNIALSEGKLARRAERLYREWLSWSEYYKYNCEDALRALLNDKENLLHREEAINRPTTFAWVSFCSTLAHCQMIKQEVDFYPGDPQAYFWDLVRFGKDDYAWMQPETAYHITKEFLDLDVISVLDIFKEMFPESTLTARLAREGVRTVRVFAKMRTWEKRQIKPEP